MRGNNESVSQNFTLRVKQYAGGEKIILWPVRRIIMITWAQCYTFSWRRRHMNYNISALYSTWTMVKGPESGDQSLKSGLRTPQNVSWGKVKMWDPSVIL